MPEGNQPTAHAARGRLMRATAVMASGTLISRVLGFAKGILLVIVLGSGTALADAYSLATLIPNSLYMILAGGALNTVLVPQIVRHTKSDADGGEGFINRIMTAFLILLGLVTVVAIPLTGWVIRPWTNARWLAPDMAAHWDQLVLLAALTMPQLFFFGAFFLVGQVLNAQDKFGPMMWAPILNNIVGIGVLGLYLVVWGTSATSGVPFTDAQVYLLGIGSTVGIVVQTLALVPATRAIGFRYRPRFDLRGQGLGATFHLAKWMLGYVLLTILVQAVVSNLATGATGTPGDGVGAGLTAYNTAYLVWLLPHSLLTVSLATAMLPSASRLAAAQDFAGVAAETTRTLRLALTFLVPASLAFIALALPFARLAFGHGANTETYPFIGWTLMAFAVGLIPFTMQYVHLRGFYALEDTRTPFLIQIGIAAVNIVLALVLVAVDANPATVAPRLALAYALSYGVGAWLTHRALAKRLPALSGSELLRHIAQLLLAVLPGALLAGLAAWWSQGRAYVVVLGVFLAAIVVAGLSFFFLAKRLGIAETTELLSVLRRRRAAGTTEDQTPVSGSDATEATTQRPDHALLDYPHPGQPSATGDPDPVPGVGAAGDVLDRRFRLDQPLNRRGSTVTWRAWDLNLSRPVLMHILDPDEPRVLEILDQARQAAQAVDSRYLRVWDATLDESGEHGSFIVCEYAPGQSLELALRQGPLTDVEAAWVVREVAAGLVSMHAQGLYHRQLNPDTVVITASGNVKIVGFLVENALHPRGLDIDPEQADALGLGALLYAGLTGHWPGPAAYGLRGAPTDSKGRPLLPRQINKSVSTELSDIADRILSPTPRGRATRLQTASDIAVALSAVLGGTDAANDLEARLRYPIEPVRITEPKVRPSAGTPSSVTSVPSASVPSASLTTTSVTGSVAGAPDTEPDDTARHLPFSGHDTGPLSTRADDRPASPWGRPPAEPVDDGTEISTQAFWLDDIDEEDPPVGSATASPAALASGGGLSGGASSATSASHPATPIPPPRGSVPTGRRSADPPRRWQALLLLLFVLVLLFSLGLVFVNQFNRSRAQPPAPTAPYAIVGARDFDPAGDGGDGVENPEQARFVMDGDPSTAWTTERYGRSANFNGLKPGAGVVIDLGEAKPVSWVTVDVGAGATTAEIRVPADPLTTEVPLGSRDDWRRIAGFSDATGAVDVKLDAEIETRWLLVYLTSMPRDGANYVGAIHEVRVSR